MSSPDWMKEFGEFQKADESLPSSRLSKNILGRIHNDLNPSVWKVSAKMGWIHAIVGTLTLLICPQFGVSLLPGHGLMYVFMHFGMTACMFVCGGLFLGVSALVAGLWMRPEEIRVIRHSRLWLFSLLGALSLLTFMIFGANMALPLAAAWLLGAFIFASASLELGWHIQARWHALS